MEAAYLRLFEEVGKSGDTRDKNILYSILTGKEVLIGYHGARGFETVA
jgi:hypothetical protein